MKLLTSLFDKIFFTTGVILFLQLPHFIDQYTQRIGGYSESKNQQLASYQIIAQNNFDGDIEKLIKNFISSTDKAVRETGENIEQIKDEALILKHEVEILDDENLLSKVIFLSTNLRYDLAKGTLRSFQPGIPLNVWALVYGLIGGILFSLLFNGSVFIPKKIIKNRKLKKSKTFTS